MPLRLVVVWPAWRFRDRERWQLAAAAGEWWGALLRAGPRTLTPKCVGKGPGSRSRALGHPGNVSRKQLQGAGGAGSEPVRRGVCGSWLQASPWGQQGASLTIASLLPSPLAGAPPHPRLQKVMPPWPAQSISATSPPHILAGTFVGRRASWEQRWRAGGRGGVTYVRGSLVDDSWFCCEPKALRLTLQVTATPS